MSHKEFRRIVAEAKTAVLFIHGIAGTPNHFNAFVELVPRDISILNLLLDGHGAGVKDFSHTSMKKWENQIEAAVRELSQTHKEIYIVAHSMGTLFAIEQAIKNEKIKKLFLLAVPLKICVRYKLFSNSLKVYFDKIKPDDPMATAAKNCYGIEQDKNLFSYLGWIPRYLELFKKIRYIRKSLALLNKGCTAYQSSFDEMVSSKSITYLKQNSRISVVELSSSSHYYYDEADFDFLLSDFVNFIDDILGESSNS